MAVNNESTIFQGDDDMHDNDDSPTSNNVDNDSNSLRDSSDSNESSSFLNGSSTGEWRAGQTQHGAAKSIRNFVHSGAVMTVGIHFEYTIWASIIMPIALIHSEHVFAYITEVLRATIGWSWSQTRCARSHGNQMNESI